MGVLAKCIKPSDIAKNKPRGPGCRRLPYLMSPFWLVMQVLIVVFVLIGIVIAITKLA